MTPLSSKRSVLYFLLCLLLLVGGTGTLAWLAFRAGPDDAPSPTSTAAAVGQTRRKKPDVAEKTRVVENRLAEKDRQIAELQTRAEQLERQVAEQEQIIRQHALTKTTRSVDELLIFFPARFPKGDWAHETLHCEDCWFKSSDGLRLHGWYFPHDGPQAAVLFAHGNAGNLSHRAGLMQFLHDRFHLSLLIFDYRGYGRSEGMPTVEGVLRDVRAARDYLAAREKIAPTDVVLMGRSLGGAIVIDLAGKEGARGLILESTFSSLKDVAHTHYSPRLVNALMPNRLDSVSQIKKYRGPLLQSHGDADRTIPFSLGKKLFDAANEPKQFVALPGCDHNDRQTDEYYEALDGFFESLPKVSQAP